MRLALTCILIALASITVNAEQSQQSHAKVLVDNLAKWGHHRVERYSYNVHYLGYVPLVGELPPVRVHVRDGKISETRLLANFGKLRAGSKAPTEPYVSRFWRHTVPDLFTIAASAIQASPTESDTQVRIGYDETFGFPAYISVSDPTIADADGEWQISDFSVEK
ncbi:MAG: DUF6174 domain-containing protein [Steroidobacteraceae bacterium]